MNGFPHVSTRRQLLRAGIGAAALLGGAGSLLAACGGSSDAAGQGAETGGGGLDRLTAMMPFPLYLAFIPEVTAVSGGYLEREGIDLELHFARSAPQALQQLTAGNVAVIRNAPIGTVRAISREQAPIVSIAMVNQEIIYVLVSSPSSPVDGLAALQGQAVGLATLAGNAEDTLDLVLKGAGLDPAAVERRAVGNEAAALTFVERGEVAAIFATREAAASMAAAGLAPHVAEIKGANPLLGTSLVVRRETLAERHDVLVRYLRALRAVMLDLRDDARLGELIPRVRADWELPQLDDPASAKPVIAAISSAWVAAGEENLLRHVPARWEEGVAEFEQLGIAAPRSDPAGFYTNELVDEALA